MTESENENDHFDLDHFDHVYFLFPVVRNERSDL